MIQIGKTRLCCHVHPGVETCRGMTHLLTFYISKGGGADVPLFETIKTNAGTQPKNELQL